MLDERQSHEGDIRAARGSRLEYRTRFLTAPPAGILEQKRDCSQSTQIPTCRNLLTPEIPQMRDPILVTLLIPIENATPL